MLAYACAEEAKSQSRSREPSVWRGNARAHFGKMLYCRRSVQSFWTKQMEGVLSVEIEIVGIYSSTSNAGTTFCQPAVQFGD